MVLTASTPPFSKNFIEFFTFIFSRSFYFVLLVVRNCLDNDISRWFFMEEQIDHCLDMSRLLMAFMTLKTIVFKKENKNFQLGICFLFCQFVI